MNAPDSPSATPSTPAPRRTARTVGLVVGGLVLVAASAVLLAPTLVSWGLFRGMIVGAVQDNVNGTVSIKNLRVGWSGPLAVEGLTIDDPSGGTRIAADVSVEQGLWTLVTSGVSQLDVRLSSSIRTRREADGTLTISRLAKASPAQPVPDRAAPANGAAPFTLPAGIRRAALKLEKLDVEVVDASGSIFAALRGLAGTLAVDAGGVTAAKIAGTTELEGKSGSIDLDAKLPGLFAADGSLALGAAGAEIDLRATDVALRAAELGLRIPSATVSVKAPKLTGRADIGIDVSASVEGAAPAALKGSIVVDRLLTPEGAPVVDLAGIHGTIALADLPTAPFERFAKDTGVVLARDVGPTVALDAAFADAAGGDLSVRLRSAAVTLTAAGSVDPATRAATFRSIEADAAIAPPLLDSLAQLTVSAPARLELRARDVVVPAAGADGAIPVDSAAFAADVTLALPGLRVPGPEGRVALDVAAIRLSAKARPVSAGIELDATADRAQPGDGAPMRIEARVRRGGAFGAYGTLRVSDLPTALVRPFVPASVPVDVEQDLGPVIRTVDASLGAGDAPDVALKADAPYLKADLRATVSSDRTIRVQPGSSLDASPLRRTLLARFGVDADADLSAGVTVKRLEIPTAQAFDLARASFDVEAAARPFAQPPVAIRLGSGDAARTVRVTDARITASSEALGTQARATALLRSDLADLDASVEAKGLGDLSQKSIERAVLALDATVGGISPVRLAQEVPAAKDILPQLGPAPWGAKVGYRGSLLSGDGTIDVRAGSATVAAKASLREDALTIESAVAADVTPALVAAVAPGLGVAIAEPARVEVAVDRVSMKRTVPWEFALPPSVHAVVRAAPIEVSGIAGLQGSPVLRDLAIDATATLGDRTSARGTLAASIAARRAAGQPVQVAPLRSSFEWTAAAGNEPMGWKADVALEPISADGLAALVDLDEAMRKEIGSGARIAAKAQSMGADGLSFEASSTLERLKANVKGQLSQGELALSGSSVDLTIPAAQATELLNSLSSAPPKDGAKPAPAWKEVGAVAVQASIDSFRMKLGAGFSSAVARVDVKPFAMVAADGERVTVESISAAVDAPGAQKPATVRASLLLAGAGGARAPVTLDAKLSNWAAADGSFSVESLRVDGTLAAEKASTRVVGALLGMGAELPEMVGPDLTVSAKAVSSGPGTASATLRASGRFVTLDAPQLVLRKGLLTVVPEKPVTLDFVPSEPVRRRYLASINPILRDVRLADDKKPIRFAVESVSYPVDGDLSKLNGDMRLTVGAVLLERNADNELLNLLKVFQGKDSKPIDGTIDPLVVQIRKGQLAYNDFSVGIERQGDGWRTRLIFDGDIDLTKQPAFARTIAANYPMGSLAREVVGLLPNEDGGGTVANVLNTMSLGVGEALQLRIRFRGPLGDVDGKPAKLERKVKVVFDGKQMGKDIGKTVETVGDVIGDLFKKKGK